MTEVVVNGISGGDLDLASTKAALSSSSTSLRLGHLRTLEERIASNGKKPLVLYFLNSD
jgi:hypothetical protein